MLFKYWNEILKGIVALTKFSVQRGLAFRVKTAMHNFPSNVNYLGPWTFGKYLFDILQSAIESNGINEADCRSKSSGNACNMSEVNSGGQARFLEVNSLTEVVPCSARSLNLIGSFAVPKQ